MFEQVKDIIVSAGDMIKQAREYNVTYKGTTDFVTDIDVAVQNYLIQNLKNLIPDAEFMGEEKVNDGIDWNKYVWIIDPIDGTTNFIHNFSHSTISVALSYNEDVVLGIVYQPFTGELFYAESGKGAYCNGNSIHVTNNAIDNSLISIGTVPGSRELADKSFIIARRLYDRCHDIRRIGCASLELCYLAAGKIDGFVELSLKPWDYAAGMLILKEAGGKCSMPSGEALSLKSGSGVVAGNELVYRKMLEFIALIN